MRLLAIVERASERAFSCNQFSDYPLFFLKVHLCVCGGVYVHGARTYIQVYMTSIVRGQLEESVLSLYHVGPGDQTQAWWQVP